MAPLKDEHGIDGAEDYPGDEGDSGEEGSTEEDAGEEGSEEEGPAEEGSGEEGPGEEGSGEEPADEGTGEGPEAPAGEPEVHEVSAERPRRRRHRRRAHRRRRRPEDEPKPNTKRWAIIIGIIIIGTSIAGAWFFLGPAGSISKITLIARSYKEDVTNVSGMALLAMIDTGKPSSLSGSADLKISRAGTGVYSGQVEVSGSQAKKNLPYGQFATGNGDYRVELIYQGFATTTTFSIAEIIEKLEVTAYNITTVNNATLVPPGSARLGFTVTFLNNKDATQWATDKDSLEVEIIKGGVSDKHAEIPRSLTQVKQNYPVSGNGNYTVRATFFNSKVKAGSQYSRIEAMATDTFTKAPYVLVSIPPTAVPRSDKTTAQWKLADGGAVFKFDATGSIAYEGATFWNYTWDFGDGDGSIEPKATHTYTMPPAVGEPPLKYVVTLTVVDSNEQAASTQIEVTVTV